ncbi:hypothetical protein MIR68_008093 [Amoeboaphelidium protococcarum]|nr:hypothetical protein MIR68_008093 [Amoeboaphelidium protococcarum]
MGKTNAERRLQAVNSNLTLDRQLIGQVKINDNVSIDIYRPQYPQLVPHVPDLPRLMQAFKTMQLYVQWLMQKYALGQDAFLIGPPSRMKRQIALAFAQLLRKEVEYLIITGETTESDLKLRREIVDASVVFVEQAPVKAALYGRILIIEGIERAERNILPILNNLLENRELQLDDGRFFMNPKAFDNLITTGGQTVEQLNSQNLFRISEQFMVIALGLPVPKYKGFMLDPPFRSRFQSRSLSLSQFDADFMAKVFRIDDLKVQNLVQIVLKFKSLINAAAEAQSEISECIADFDTLMEVCTRLDVQTIDTIQMLSCIYPPLYRLLYNNVILQILVECGLNTVSQKPGSELGLDQQQALNVISTMIRAGQNVALIGESGCGKSYLVQQLSMHLGKDKQQIIVIPVHSDVTYKDLLQTRSTDSKGNTVWRNSLLVEAALNGHIVVLDGVHQLHPDVLNALSWFMQMRSVTLPDGTLVTDGHQADGETSMKADRNVIYAHSNFRVIAVGAIDATKQVNGPAVDWITPQLQNCLVFVHLRNLPLEQCRSIILQRVNGADPHLIQKLLQLSLQLRTSDEVLLQPLKEFLNIVQLKRLVLMHYQYGMSLQMLIRDACLYSILPLDVQKVLDRLIQDHLGVEQVNSTLSIDILNQNGETVVKAGQQRYAVTNERDRELIPNVFFVQNKSQMNILNRMCLCYIESQPILLIGNQGVGKNKIADKFCQMLQLPRQYMQLNRDSTFQSLVSVPTFDSGAIRYVDSPLVTAAIRGHVVVIDEADKASPQVLAALKSLIKDQLLHLGDGRVLVGSQELSGGSSLSSLPIHKDFRLIVLANRAGFPFQGNDFYASMSDCFCPFVVQNPDRESELEMVRQYAPDIHDTVLVQLQALFTDLRELSDKGQLSYPYSTRELVNVVKQLQKFPSSSISIALRNVFDFDSYDSDRANLISSILAKHGLAPLLSSADSLLSGRFAVSRSIYPPISVNVNTVYSLIQVSAPRIETFPLSLGSSVKLFADRRLVPIDSAYCNGTEITQVFILPFKSLSCNVDQFANGKFLMIDQNPYSIVILDLQRMEAIEYDVHDTFRNSTQQEPMDIQFCSVCTISDQQSWKAVLLHESMSRLYSYDFDRNIVSFFPLDEVAGSGKLCIIKLGESQVGIYRQQCHHFLVIDFQLNKKVLITFNQAVQSIQKFVGDGLILISTATGSKLMLDRLKWTMYEIPQLPDLLCFPLSDGFVAQADIQNTSSLLSIVSVGSNEVALNMSDQITDFQTVVCSQQDVTVVCNHEHIDISYPDSLVRLKLSRSDSRALQCLPSGLPGGFFLFKGDCIFQLNTQRQRHQLHGASSSQESDSNPEIMLSFNGVPGIGFGDGDGDGQGEGHGASERKDTQFSAEHHLSTRETSPQLSQEILEAQQRVRQAALKKRLSAISNSEIQAEEYERRKQKIFGSIRELKTILEASELKTKEKQWQSNQVYGDFDDRKIVDSVVGERNIYKRRLVKDNNPFATNLQPKKLIISFDVSASMSRYNPHDGRLERTLEVALMLLESLCGFEHKFKYEICGHSGDSAYIPFVKPSQYPKTDSERLKIIEEMHAHSTHCIAGDNTLNALRLVTDAAASTDSQEEFDERIVILISDANIEQYGISASDLRQEMENVKENVVSSYLIFIGSLRDQAQKLLKELPVGHCYICEDSSELPGIVRRILSQRL